ALRSDGRSGGPAETHLFENQTELGPAHTSHEDIRRAGSGSFSHWRSGIVFSSSDGSKPSQNGRRYYAVATKAVDPSLVIGLLILGMCVILGGNVAFAAFARGLASPRATDERRHRTLALLVALSFPCFAFAATSAWLPPLWNSTDSSGFLIWQWDFIPHFPPL